MKLKKLIKNLDVVSIIGSTDKDITDVKADSNFITHGSLFICLKGGEADGHLYASQAEKYGAVAVICERKIDVNVTQIIVKDTRAALSVIASEFYGRVDKKLNLIAVVGTNGKTTTTHMIYDIMTKAGEKCGVIGTLGAFYGDKFIEPTLTTPDPLVLHKILADMYSDGVTTVVMEVSAHAIFYEKVKGLAFKVGVFTNFSRDHLDFFNDLEEYKQVKKSFFKDNKCEFMVVNSDDAVGVEIIGEMERAVTYGIENPADVFAIKLESDTSGTSFVLNLFDCIYTVKLPLIGRFNVLNALAASTTSALLGVKTEIIAESLSRLKGASGRLECVHKSGYSVYVDYAHTPDGLYKSLSALRPLTKGRLICVFGCGGNRDEGKRREMGAISGKLADFTIVTSDNPRFEDPMEIIREIELGVLETSKNYLLIEDREDAIKYALNYAKADDVIIIAGKGAENYQEILGIKRLYNDKDTVKEILQGERS